MKWLLRILYSLYDLGLTYHLLDGNITLQQIADKLDFDEASNLIKFFKKFEKMTPSEFKKHHQNKIC